MPRPTAIVCHPSRDATCAGNFPFTYAGLTSNECFSAAPPPNGALLPIGKAVQANFQGEGRCFNATIIKVHANDTYDLEYTGDGEDCDSGTTGTAAAGGGPCKLCTTGKLQRDQKFTESNGQEQNCGATHEFCGADPAKCGGCDVFSKLFTVSPCCGAEDKDDEDDEYEDEDEDDSGGGGRRLNNDEGGDSSGNGDSDGGENGGRQSWTEMNVKREMIRSKIDAKKAWCMTGTSGSGKWGECECGECTFE